jgi:lipoprotein-releasing system ATP-binding protein
MDKDRQEPIDIQSNTTNEQAGLLQAYGLCKSFQSSTARIQILKDLNLSLGHGETLAVVGASGIGKSTLLHILGTLDKPDSGILQFQGHKVFDYTEQQLSEFRNKMMGFIFQFHHLLPEFTALENTMMPALIQGLGKGRAEASAREILGRVGLTDRLMHKAVDLSGGEQQRVALARALMLKPALLLADEPTGNLDKQHSSQVHRLLLELNRELEMAMIIVTHNQELASLMDRQATIANGGLEYLA